jgi:sulfofructose kinase
MKVLCIGHASYDISIIVNEYPKENTKYRVGEKVECGGGPACNAAYLLGCWDVDVYFQGIVGNDLYGKRIIEELKQKKVNTDYVEQNNDEDTSLSFIFVNKNNASRTLFNIGKKTAKIKKLKYDFTPDIIHIDGNYYEASINAFEKFPNAIKVIDAGRITDELLDLCHRVDYLVCSKGFAETIAGIKIDYKNLTTLKEVYEKLEKEFLCHIVITLEEKGVLYRENNKIKIMSALKVNAVDTTGAGDFFHGAFVYGLVNKLPIEKCVKIANVAAGLTVKEIGRQNKVPDIEKVYEIYKKNGK